MNSKVPNWLRWVFTVVLLLIDLLLWYIAITVPMTGAAGPAIIAIFLTVLTWYTWPTRKRHQNENLTQT